MTENTIPDLSGFAGMLENWMATQKKFAPSGRIMAEVADAVRTISQAQLAYSQAVMQANASLLAAMWEAAAIPGMHKANAGESPSQGVHRPDLAAP